MTTIVDDLKSGAKRSAFIAFQLKFMQMTRITKEIKNLNPTVIQVNKKFRVKVATINDISEFDIFFNKIINTKFDNYNIIVE